MGGLVWFVGMVLFSVSIIRTGFFPRWTGVVMAIGTVVFTGMQLLGGPQLLLNVSNILFAATVVYMSVLGLRATPAGAPG